MLFMKRMRCVPLPFGFVFFILLLYLLFWRGSWLFFLFISVTMTRDQLVLGRLLYRIRETREPLMMCPVENCDGSGHVSSNFSSHRRQAAGAHAPPWHVFALVGLGLSITKLISTNAYAITNYVCWFTT